MAIAYYPNNFSNYAQREFIDSVVYNGVNCNSVLYNGVDCMPYEYYMNSAKNPVLSPNTNYAELVINESGANFVPVQNNSFEETLIGSTSKNSILRLIVEHENPDYVVFQFDMYAAPEPITVDSSFKSKFLVSEVNYQHNQSYGYGSSGKVVSGYCTNGVLNPVSLDTYVIVDLRDCKNKYKKPFVFDIQHNFENYLNMAATITQTTHIKKIFPVYESTSYANSAVEKIIRIMEGGQT